LELPKQLLLDHGFSGDRFIASAGSNSMQPNMVHMWYLWALALNGPVAAALVHWGLGVLLALATVLLASVLLPPGHAWLAGCLVLLCPGVQHQLSLPLADLGLALFCTLALAAVGRIAIHLETARWPIAAGLMLGGAIATMPAGLAFAAAVGSFLAYVCGSSREPRRELAQAARPILAAALITAAPGLFFLGFALHQPGSTQSLQSVAIHLGPLLLLALGVLPATRRLRGLGLIVGVSAIYFVLASCSPWPGRWWSPLVPPAGIVAVWVWQEIANGPRAMSGLASIAVVLLAMTVPILGWTRSLGALAVATGWQHRDDFLLAREPIYRAASMLNRIGRSTDRLLCEACPGASTASTFYFNCAVTRKVAAGNSKSGSSAARDDAAWIEAARSGGFSYLLLAEALESASDARSNDMRSNLDGPHLFGSGDEVGPIGEVIPILEYQSADDNNRPIRYRLLRVAKCRR
jgi:hypothetical protein